MFRVVIAPVAALLLVLGAGSAGAARDRLVSIGKSQLDSNASVAGIDVSQADGAYKGIRLIARKGPIDFTGVRIVYDDATFHVIEKEFRLDPGERTIPLDLSRQDRFIDTIFVKYKGAIPSMELEVLGIQSRSGARKKRSKPANPAAISQPSGAPAVAAVESILADPTKIIDGRDVMFGYRDVSFGDERETIEVSSETGKFHAIRLRVLGSDVFISQLDVVYADGTRQTLPINAAVKVNQKTQWFRVDAEKFIKQFELAYKPRSKRDKGKARVEVVGQFAGDWLAASGEGRKYNEGWVLLGSETAGAIGFDKDVVSVGQNEGGFSRLRLRVRDRSITLREVRVAYLDGSNDVIRTNDRVDPGQIAGPWQLKSGKPAIKEIVAVYRRRMIFGKGKGAAVVELWGQH